MASIKQLPEFFGDYPLDKLGVNWGGYSAKRDKTMLPQNFLVDPSINCFIPDGDKVLPRFGTQKVFQGNAPILNDGTIGGYTKFKNFAGIEMDVKSYRDATQGEQVKVLFNNVYVPITKNPNTSLNGTGRLYFSTYDDANLDVSLSLRISRLCWTNGYKHSDKTGRVFSWTGGISTILTIAANVITIPSGQTFRELGFTTFFPTATQIRVTINGVEFFSTNLAELDGTTLTLNASPTAVPGDIVTSAIEVDELVAPMENLHQSQNYMYYGNEMFRQWYMSNQYARPSTTRITLSNAQQDDLIIDPSTNYTGKGRNIYKLVIDSITPAVNSQFFVGVGANSSYFDTSAYTGTGNNKYRIAIISDSVFTPTGGGTFTDGEYIVGQNSGTVLQVIFGGNFAGGACGTRYVSGVPDVAGNEVFKGTSSGSSVQIFAFLFSNSAQMYKNNTQVTGLTGMTNFGSVLGVLQMALVGNQITTPSQIDGVQFVTTQVAGNKVGDYYELDIQLAKPDTFTWQKNNGSTNSGTVTTTPQTIEDGIVVEWSQDMGHAVGDYWLIEVNQEITRPWANFYYSIDLATKNSVRRPGEGYVYSLPSNFWAMDTLEEAMYVNTSNGEWGYSSPKLSADLLSEDISFISLKQVGAAKVLYPYLTGHNRNDLLFIDNTKNLNSLGRLKLIEKVQSNTMSYIVFDKFKSLSFKNGSIVFQDDSIWITSPEDFTMMVLNERTKYWQPPQFIPNLGLLTVIENDLYVHSTLDTATRSLNDPTAIGDDGVEYEVIVRGPTYAIGDGVGRSVAFYHADRWNKKSANMAFWEGYVDEAPPMKMNIYFDVDGCTDIKNADIVPIFCTDIKNAGNFGGKQDGGHEHGGDKTVKTNYARFLYEEMGVQSFYFVSMEFTCRTKKHTYQILSMGINLAQSKSNNKEYKSKELLPI